MDAFREIEKGEFKLMIVDDETPMRKMLLKGLARAGYDCVEAESGVEALEIMADTPIDVVVTDINMPRMDGIELTENIREHFDADVIVMTALTQKFNYEKVILQGASDFIQKPVELDELNLRILRVLRERTNLEQRKKAEQENIEVLKALKKTVGGTIFAMAMTIDIRDPCTAGHQRRVATLARAIGKQLGLSRIQLEGISMGGVIHDLGKIAIPSEILSKPSKLNEAETLLMQTHPKAGYDILKNIDFPWPLAEIAYQHHERLDGNGYPMRLMKNEIIFEAKIMAVADVVEAMASHRPYRPAMGVNAALEYVRSERGAGFDRQVVDACVSLFKEKGFAF